VTASAPRARTDQCLALMQAAAHAGVADLAHQAGGDEEGEEVATEQPLRQRRLTAADGEVDLVSGHQLLGDLVAGVAAADDQDGTTGDRPGIAVGAAVQLRDARVELVGERGRARRLERAGRD
jgi:hypothetical protein